MHIKGFGSCGFVGSRLASNESALFSQGAGILPMLRLLMSSRVTAPVGLGIYMTRDPLPTCSWYCAIRNLHRGLADCFVSE